MGGLVCVAWGWVGYVDGCAWMRGTSGGWTPVSWDGRLFVAALHDLRLISDSPFPSIRPSHPTAMPRQQQPQPQSTPQQQEAAAEGAKVNGAVVQANNGTAAGEADGEQDKEGQEEKEKEKEKGGCASDWKDMRGRSLCQSASAALVCPSCPCPER